MSCLFLLSVRRTSYWWAAIAHGVAHDKGCLEALHASRAGMALPRTCQACRARLVGRVQLLRCLPRCA
eukprot:2956431-Pyramimonas_sp.AAC.1